jgi:cell division protein FtsB
VSGSTGSVTAREAELVLRLSPLAKFLALTVGIIVIVTGLSFVGVLPVRTFTNQKNELVAKQARSQMLAQHNQELSGRIAVLQTDKEVIRLARDQFGMVPPGETLTVLPGLRDASTVLGGDGSSAVVAAPPASGSQEPSFFEAVTRLLSFWR